MALLVATGFLIAITTESGPPAVRWREIIGRSLTLYARMAVEKYEMQGRAELQNWLAQLDRDSGIRTVVYDGNGQEVSGREIPEGAPELYERATRDPHSDRAFYAGRTLGAWVVTSDQGARYVVVSEYPGGFFGPFRPPIRPGLRLLHFLGVMLVTGLVCYGLARYLTAPISRLREASRRLAHGDLKARADLSIGKRRDELTDLGHDFDVMAERIESLITSQRRLVSDISHELRSPLARLNVALELARQRTGSAARTELDRIERESARLNELIGQLLTLSKLESGTELPQAQTVDLAALVREISADADFEARSRQCSIRLLAITECATAGSPELLRRAIENVVRNAVRYTAEQTAVEISLRCESDQAVITVRDHGGGVPESSLTELFRPFYRVADARDRQTGGIGLGLAITERAVRLHHGSVRAANADSDGLIVEIRLPLERKKRDDGTNGINGTD